MEAEELHNEMPLTRVAEIRVALLTPGHEILFTAVGAIEGLRVSAHHALVT